MLPEEIVRQDLIDKMVGSLRYPESLIGVEKELKSLPHLKNEKLPIRRVDIICFAKGIHKKYSLYPLLVVECKAKKLTEDAIEQVLGYNYFIKAFFVAIANKDKIKTFFYDNKKKMSFVNFLPTYDQLIDAVKKF